MDGYSYPLSLLFIAVLAFYFNRSNSFILMSIALAFGAYIIYSHETGHTATEFTNEMVQDLDEAARSKYQHDNEIKSNEIKKEMLESLDEQHKN